MPRKPKMELTPCGKENRFVKRYRGSRLYYKLEPGETYQTGYRRCLEKFHKDKARIDAAPEHELRKLTELIHQHTTEDAEAVMTAARMTGNSQTFLHAWALGYIVRSFISKHGTITRADEEKIARNPWDYCDDVVLEGSGGYQAPRLPEFVVESITTNPVEPVTPPETGQFEEFVEGTHAATELQEIRDSAVSFAEQPGMTDYSLENVVKRYQEDQRGRVGAKSGGITAGRLDNIIKATDDFAAIVGVAVDIRELNGPEIRKYQRKLQRSKLAKSTISTKFRTIRAFFTWCEEEEIIDRTPKLVTSKSFSEQGETKGDKGFSVEEFQKLIGEGCDELVRAVYLMMANCGLDIGDIAAIRHDEIDWETGRLSHARNKTSEKDPQTVVWKLWPETLELLRKTAADPKVSDLVLLTAKGEKLVDEWLDKDGKRHVTRRFQEMHKRRCKVLGLPSKGNGTRRIRKRSATMVKGNLKYRGLEDLFLAHKDGKMSAHYTQESETILDECIDWLREEYKLEEVLG